MRRRDFITFVGGAAAGWPLAARAQQPGMPVVGFLHAASADGVADRLRAFRQGLKENGYIEGENVSIIYRWAEGQNDRLPELAAELVRRPVGVIAAVASNNVAFAAQAATRTIPIVFAVSDDPVKLGLVASLAHPGGNMTGVNFFNAEITAKRLELLRKLVPGAERVALLVNPKEASIERVVQEVEKAASTMGLQIQTLNATTSREIDAAFATMARERPDALFVSGGPFFNSRRLQFGMLAARQAVPAIYASRDYPEFGGLMSYGTNVADAFRQVGVYSGSILKGAKPAELPVVQSSKFELVINAQTARMLGLTVPPSLLAVADEVIE